jgi:hypothetical protein
MDSKAWKRATAWRQGSVVPRDAAISLGILGEAQTGAEVLLVVSHDCDIAEDNLDLEPTVEGIVGEIVDDADPNLTYAKSTNTLHLKILLEDHPCVVQLRAPRKLSISKLSLSSVDPDKKYVLSQKGRQILQSWLADRYRRSAFPDALHKHISTIRKTLHEAGKAAPDAIVGFYMSFDPEIEITNEDEPYELWIAVVFDHLVPSADEIAEEVALKISRRLENKFKTAEGWKSIDLRSCQARSDFEFSLYDAQTMKLYRLEHISLKYSERDSNEV